MDDSQAGAPITSAHAPDTRTETVAASTAPGTAPVVAFRVTRMPFRRIAAFIVTVGVMVFSMTLYSFNTGLRLAERHTPLIYAIMEIKLETTTAHLRFKEILSNERPEDIESVRLHLQQSDWYARAMLEGGTNPEGTFVALSEPELIIKVGRVRELLAEFSRLVDVRWRARLSPDGGNGPSHEQAFDRVAEEIVTVSDEVEWRLQDLNSATIETFKIMQFSLGSLTLLATLVIVYIFMRFAREQNQNLGDLHREVQQRIEAEETLRRQATTDTLTKLYNRRHITDLMNQELKRTERRETPFCVILFDLDRFKSINDNFGHDTGDKVLQSVAQTISERLRELDAFARWGGEEFLILVRETTLEGAMALAEICRARLAQTDMEDVGRVTASFGVAQFENGENVRELVHRADQALYAAKNAGRNRVMGAEA